MAASPLAAQSFSVPEADILVLGEIHDSAESHARQAQIIRQVTPTALVFEMLTPDQAAAADGVDRSDQAALGDALGWADSGWPDFAIYYPIFAAAPEAAIQGAAVDRNDLRAAMQDGAAAAFGADAADWGLIPLSQEERDRRVALQAAAHCNALPEGMLPGMVAAQRLRDAAFARATVAAYDAHGGPVVLIVGTGHADKRSGVPAAIAVARPELRVWALGQLESGGPSDAGAFDTLLTVPRVDRPDPCAAFTN